MIKKEVTKEQFNGKCDYRKHRCPMVATHPLPPQVCVVGVVQMQQEVVGREAQPALELLLETGWGRVHLPHVHGRTSLPLCP